MINYAFGACDHRFLPLIADDGAAGHFEPDVLRDLKLDRLLVHFGNRAVDTA